MLYAFSDSLEPTCPLGLGCLLTGEPWLLLFLSCLVPLRTISISSVVKVGLGHGSHNESNNITEDHI